MDAIRDFFMQILMRLRLAEPRCNPRKMAIFGHYALGANKQAAFRACTAKIAYS